MSTQAAAHASHDHPEPNYLMVMAVMAVLTVTEIGIAVPRLPEGSSMKLLQAFTLVSLALVKATGVGLYFMHLKFEKRTLGVIAFTPLILCTWLIFMLLPDLTGHNRATDKQIVAEAKAALGEHEAGGAEHAEH